ncbi:MAG: conjugal transfer protein TraH [Pseudomonadota bacterium]
MIRSLRTVLCSTAALALSACSASAQVAGHMDDFWDDLGVAANVTGPSSFEGQRAGYYTLGNVYVRTPQRTLNPVNIQMPGYRAGCGGIDIYGGGFSYVNSAELVAFMKSVANNAASFAFQVALETISPVIAEKVGELQSVAQRINEFAMNSCESGQLAVAAVWPKSDQASRVICEASASRRGLYPDWVAARHGCGSEGERSSVLAGASDDEKAALPQNINIAWDALKKHPVGSGDRELMQFLMTLSGTEILRAGADDDAQQSYQFLPSKMLDPGVIAAFLDGGTVEIYECDGGDPEDRCLNPTAGGTVTIDAADGLRSRVSQMLADIMGKVRTRTALSAAEQQFLNVTSLPVYKMINVHAAYEGVFADQTIQSYAEIIAVDLLYGLFEDYAEMLSEAGSVATSGDRDAVESWRAQLLRQREFLVQYQIENNARTQVIEQVVARTQAIERQLAGRLSKDLADAYAFSKNAAY